MTVSPHAAAQIRIGRALQRNHDAGGRLVKGHRLARKLPRPQYPHAIEAAYAKALVDFVDRLRGAMRPALAKLPDLLKRAQAERGDRFDVGTVSELQSLIDQARSSLTASLDTGTLRQLAARHATATDAFAKAQFQRQVRAAIGVDVATMDKHVPSLIEHFAAENVQLIKSLGNKTLDDVAKAATRALTSGTTVEDLTSEIADRYGIAERHARLIARDQVGKLNGQLAASRQKEIGVTRFYWRDCGDDKVRPEHEDLAAGGPYSYDDPPSEGLPGTPICCRCTPEPVMEDVLGSLDDEDETT